MFKTMEEATSCSRCDEVFDPDGDYRVGIPEKSGDGYKEVICYICSKLEQLATYQRTGELTSRLVTDAMIAMDNLADPKVLRRKRADVIKYYVQNEKVLREIHEKGQRIEQRMKEWELNHWLGEDRIQGMYRTAENRGFSGEGDKYKILVWGSAGRVLITLQDKYKQGDSESMFGGANLTMIFDETSAEPRGGIQSYIGTVEELLGLLAYSSLNMVELKRDDEVTVA